MAGRKAGEPVRGEEASEAKPREEYSERASHEPHPGSWVRTVCDVCGHLRTVVIPMYVQRTEPQSLDGSD